MFASNIPNLILKTPCCVGFNEKFVSYCVWVERLFKLPTLDFFEVGIGCNHNKKNSGLLVEGCWRGLAKSGFENSKRIEMSKMEGKTRRHEGTRSRRHECLETQTGPSDAGQVWRCISIRSKINFVSVFTSLFIVPCIYLS